MKLEKVVKKFTQPRERQRKKTRNPNIPMRAWMRARSERMMTTPSHVAPLTSHLPWRRLWSMIRDERPCGPIYLVTGWKQSVDVVRKGRGSRS